MDYFSKQFLISSCGFFKGMAEENNLEIKCFCSTSGNIVLGEAMSTMDK